MGIIISSTKKDSFLSLCLVSPFSCVSARLVLRGKTGYPGLLQTREATYHCFLGHTVLAAGFLTDVLVRLHKCFCPEFTERFYQEQTLDFCQVLFPLKLLERSRRLSPVIRGSIPPTDRRPSNQPCIPGVSFIWSGSVILLGSWWVLSGLPLWDFCTYTHNQYKWH